MSRAITSSLTVLLVLCVASTEGSGQSPTREARYDETSALLTPGAHVRVKLPGERAWTGTLVSLANDSMLVRGASGADTTLVRLSRVTRLEVSAGKRRSPHLIRNTAIGVAIGSGLGWVIGTAMQSGGCDRHDPCWLDLWGPPTPPPTDHAMEGTLIGGLAGGALGVLGSRARTEDWRPVSVTPRGTTVRLSPRGASVAIAF